MLRINTGLLLAGAGVALRIHEAMGLFELKPEVLKYVLLFTVHGVPHTPVPLVIA